MTNFNVGDRVTSTEYGEGVIESINHTCWQHYRITVRFDNFYETYTLDGFCDLGKNISRSIRKIQTNNITKIISFRTKDGTIFETEQDAINHDEKLIKVKHFIQAVSDGFGNISMESLTKELMKVDL